jgi:hypothetical protein
MVKIVEQLVEWMSGRGNRSTRRKPASVPPCTPQIPHDLTRARTRSAMVGRRLLTAWATSRPVLPFTLLSLTAGWSQISLFPSHSLVLFLSLYKGNPSCIKTSYINKSTNSVALSPQANYFDWATATCRRNLVPTFVDRGVNVLSARPIPHDR